MHPFAGTTTDAGSMVPVDEMGCPQLEAGVVGQVAVRSTVAGAPLALQISNEPVRVCPGATGSEEVVSVLESLLPAIKDRETSSVASQSVALSVTVRE